jgi:hypothetical protein
MLIDRRAQLDLSPVKDVLDVEAEGALSSTQRAPGEGYQKQRSII